MTLKKQYAEAVEFFEECFESFTPKQKSSVGASIYYASEEPQTRERQMRHVVTVVNDVRDEVNRLLDECNKQINK